MPWEAFQKTQEDKLLDIMATIPSMMEEADLIRSQTHTLSALSATISLSGRCRAMIYSLEQWHQHWLKGVIHAPHWFQRSEIYQTLDRKHPGKVLPMALHFVDLETAHLENHYWASLLLIHATYWTTCEWVKRSFPLSSDVTPNDDECLATTVFHPLAPLSEIHTYALNIAQSLEYFLRPRFGAGGSSLTGFPLTVVMGYFEYFQLPEASWFKVILDRFQSLGIPMEQFLNGMANEDVAVLVKEVGTE